MRTGRTLTVFRKLEPPENMEQTPPQKYGADTPKNLEQTPPENLEQASPPKIWSRHSPQKFGAGTPPKKIGAGTPPENLEQAPPPVDRMTHASENITLAKTSFRPVTMYGEQ